MISTIGTKALHLTHQPPRKMYATLVNMVW
jgi:hypothetical protein